MSSSWSHLPLSFTDAFDCRRYTYSVCFFGEAVQKSNNNGQRTSLGYVRVLLLLITSKLTSLPIRSNFQGWSESAEKGTDDYYSKQVYADGQRCWNGPARSAKVSSCSSQRSV